MGLEKALYWNYKSTLENAWHPQLGLAVPKEERETQSTLLKRIDLDAAVVDVAPFIAGVGGLAHISQAHAFGFTAPASIFRNVKTMTAMHRTTLVMTPVVLLCQAAEVDYRSFIPRWAHERERGRDESEVRQHVRVGTWLCGLLWVSRMVARFGVRYWAPMEVVMGGALADLMHREYIKAHGLEYR